MKAETTRRHMIAGIAAAPLAVGATTATAQNATPATLTALRTYRAVQAHSNGDALAHWPDDDTAYRALSAAEKAILTSPIITPEDIALKLEFALSERLCGGEYGADFEGLDRAMFQGMIDALRGPIARQMQGEG